MRWRTAAPASASDASLALSNADAEQCAEPCLHRVAEPCVDRGRAREPHGQRVHRLTALADLEMDVRTGGETARSDIADHLTLADVAAGLGDDRAHMPVKAEQP